MIASSTSTPFQFAPKTLQNPLTAETQTADQPLVASAALSQTAIDEFALRFNAAMIEMLAAQGRSDASSIGKKLKAYSTAGVAPVKAASRFV